MGGCDPIASIGSHRIWTSPQVPRMGDHLELRLAPLRCDNISATSFDTIIYKLLPRVVDL
jgi:hypothetical protein